MFGIIRPCRHRLAEGLRESWIAHLCGLCLALRDDHGQAARVATNYDGLIISVLVEAQAEAATAAEGRRKAGPCPLRGMRTAEVARGEGARLAAAVSLVLASAKMRDHVEDRDGVFARKGVAGGARRVAARWARQGEGTGYDVGFDTAVLTEAVGRQGEIEALAGLGTSVLVVTEPTETATAAAFAHTAVLAGRPGNAEALAEAGRLFGRLAHLLDAVEDVHEDRESGAWNPLIATGVGPEEAYRLCRDAAHGIRLALRDVDFTDQRLAHVLLVHEVDQAVNRAFEHAGFPVKSAKSSGTSCTASAHKQDTHKHDAHKHDAHKHDRNAAGKSPDTQAAHDTHAHIEDHMILDASDLGLFGGVDALNADPDQAADARNSAPVGSWPPQQSPPGWQPPPSGPGQNPGNPFGPGQGSPWNPPSGGGSGGRPPGRRHNALIGCLIWVGLCCTCQACCREEFTDPCTGRQRKGPCNNCDDCDCSCCECGDCCDGCCCDCSC